MWGKVAEKAIDSNQKKDMKFKNRVAESIPSFGWSAGLGLCAGEG